MDEAQVVPPPLTSLDSGAYPDEFRLLSRWASEAVLKVLSAMFVPRLAPRWCGIYAKAVLCWLVSQKMATEIASDANPEILREDGFSRKDANDKMELDGKKV